MYYVCLCIVDVVLQCAEAALRLYAMFVCVYTTFACLCLFFMCLCDFRMLLSVLRMCLYMLRTLVYAMCVRVPHTDYVNVLRNRCPYLTRYARSRRGMS